MSLETLAQKVGISKMTLHRIETGVSSPSIITLAEISYHLKQPLEALFQEGEAKVVVIKREAQEKLLNNEYGIRVVAPAGLISDRIIMTYASLDEGTYIEDHTNKGLNGPFLLKGRAVVGVNGNEYPIEAGDSILFDAHFPTRSAWKNGSST